MIFMRFMMFIVATVAWANSAQAASTNAQKLEAYCYGYWQDLTESFIGSGEVLGKSLDDCSTRDNCDEVLKQMKIVLERAKLALSQKNQRADTYFSTVKIFLEKSDVVGVSELRAAEKQGKHDSEILRDPSADHTEVEPRVAQCHDPNVQ